MVTFLANWAPLIPPWLAPPYWFVPECSKVWKKQTTREKMMVIRINHSQTRISWSASSVFRRTHSATILHACKWVPSLLNLSHKLVDSVTGWLAYFSTFVHLHQWKLAQRHRKFAKVGPRFSQTINKPSKNCPRLWRLYQNGEISPNLVTLLVDLTITK